jgi:hypothetical protein
MLGHVMTTTSDLLQTRLQDMILTLVAECGSRRSICPSQAARAVGGPHPDGWGPLMPAIRRAAVDLAQAGQIVILRKGKVVDSSDFRGVYRLALPLNSGEPC